MHPVLVAGLFAGIATLPHNPKDPFQQQVVGAVSGRLGPQPQWKLDLLVRALVRGEKPYPCRVSLYHPREAGGAWRWWTGTRSSTRVRPGVASCTAAYWQRWRGAWLWIEGYGVCHVEDCFPESSDPHWFDLASPSSPDTMTYSAWLGSDERARYARDFGLQRASFVVLKGPGDG
jgi:hypothetical protein